MRTTVKFAIESPADGSESEDRIVGECPTRMPIAEAMGLLLMRWLRVVRVVNYLTQLTPFSRTARTTGHFFGDLA